MSVQDQIIEIPEPPKARDAWSSAYLVQSTRVADLYASPIEAMIAERGGKLFADDGQVERPQVQGVVIDTRA